MKSQILAHSYDSPWKPRLYDFCCVCCSWWSGRLQRNHRYGLPGRLQYAEKLIQFITLHECFWCHWLRWRKDVLKWMGVSIVISMMNKQSMRFPMLQTKITFHFITHGGIFCHIDFVTWKKLVVSKGDFIKMLLGIQY